MKKTVLIFGLIAGAIVSGLMISGVTLCSGDMETGMLIGYASMLLSFIFIFVGIINYRDKYNDGIISFGKAFRIGLYICLIASTMYVITWMIEYYFFMPDFMEKYMAKALQKMAEEGATPQEIADKTAEMEQYKKIYSTPWGVAFMTYLEIVPVGLVVSLLAALILKRKQKKALAVQ